MPNTVLGKVACTPKGDYNEGAAYVVLDIVAYGGGSYMALKDVTGVTPNNDGVNWMQLAAPGNTGDTGEQGDPGAAAGFGTVSATVDETTGTPSVKVETSGPDEKGIPGIPDRKVSRVRQQASDSPRPP